MANTKVPTIEADPVDLMPRPQGVRIALADPTTEVVASDAFGRWLAGVVALQQDIDEAERQYGLDVYEAILKDPVAGSSFDTLRQGVLAEPLTIRPAAEPDPGAAPEPRHRRAAEIAEFCRRALARPRRPLVAWLNEMLLGMTQGARLSEIVVEPVQFGPDAGKLSLKALKVKPRRCWRFVVDPYGNLQAIAGSLPPAVTPPDGASAAGVVGGEGNAVLLPVDRFALFQWDERDSDPKGRSYLRRIYNAWNLKVRTWPEKHKGDCQFGTKSLYAILPENAEDPPPGTVDDRGKPIETAEEQVVYVLRKLQNGSVAAFAHGTEIQDLKSDAGDVLGGSIALYNSEMVQGILNQTRATREAAHGSKADSQTSQDIQGLLIRLVRAILAGTVSQVCRYLVELNFGVADAEDLLPIAAFGDTEPQDKPALMGAISKLAARYLAPSQFPAVDAILGLPPRTPEEVEQLARRATAAEPEDREEKDA